MSVSALVVSVVALGAVQEPSAARTAAEHWLEIVDDGRYEESWEAASPRFRRSMARFGKGSGFWVKALTTSRGSLGEVETRTLIRSQESTSFPGADPGRFYELVYQGDFHAHEAVFETIIVTLDDDSEWRVYHYVIRR